MVRRRHDSDLERREARSGKVMDGQVTDLHATPGDTESQHDASARA